MWRFWGHGLGNLYTEAQGALLKLSNNNGVIV